MKLNRKLTFILLSFFLTIFLEIIFRHNAFSATHRKKTTNFSSKVQKKSSSAIATPEFSQRKLSHRTPEYEKISPALWRTDDLLSDVVADDSVTTVDFSKPSIQDAPFQIPGLINDDQLTSLGEIIASRHEGVILTKGEIIFIRSENQDLQTGMTYSIFSEPEKISNHTMDRSGYFYLMKGTVKIIGIRDGLYLGEIETNYDLIQRNDRIYALLPKISLPKFVTNTQTIEALLLMNPQSSLNSASQRSFIFLDRGIEDGVAPGNIFRIYDYDDPVTQNKITESDFMIAGDAVVVHATARFSTAYVIKSRKTLIPGQAAIALTHLEKEELPSSEVQDPELDELDSLDQSAGDDHPSKKEFKELRELENSPNDSSPPVSLPPLSAPIPASTLQQPQATGASTQVNHEGPSGEMDPMPPAEPLEPLEPLTPPLEETEQKTSHP